MHLKVSAMGLNKYKLGDLIAQRREKYDGKEELHSWGVSREGFIRPKQEDADTSIYNVFYRNDFVFNPARMELNSIALNTYFDKAICSSLYEVFYVTRKDVVLPEYLNIFIKRDEFARRCWYEAIGSARNYFRVGDLSLFDIILPDIETQRRYVNVFLSLQKNLEFYQSKVDEQKFVCDGYLNQLKLSYEKIRIGAYLEQTDLRNTDKKLSISSLRGISTDKVFIDTKADMLDVSLTNYKLVNPNEFAYVADTSRRGDKIALAFNDSDEPYLISSIYTVFRVKDVNVLDPHYLMMLFARIEFDRYARFNSWGSARETFEWSEMCDVYIPIPPIDIQRSIASIYRVYKERKAIATHLKEQLNKLCPILIKGSLQS